MRACSYAWLFLLAVWLMAAFLTKRTAHRENFMGSFRYRVPLIAAFLLFYSRLGLPFLSLRLWMPSNTLGGIGFAITLLGIAFAVWARFFLGGNWSAMVTVKQNHELIRNGPYAVVRHPI